MSFILHQVSHEIYLVGYNKHVFKLINWSRKQ